MKSTEDNKRNHRLFILFNIIVWTVLFLLNFLFAMPNLQYGISYALLVLTIPASMCLMYYSNYVWLVPKWFVRKRFKPFIAVNILLTVLLCFIIHVAMDTMIQHKLEMGVPQQMAPPKGLLLAALVFRDIITIALCCGAAILVKLSMLWNESDRRQRQMEVEKAETELRLLSNQIRPHFLLNTLNNIYALIAFDQDKAQMAVGELSKLLRHLLYENQQDFVPLYKEVDFMNNYIELMKIRVTDHVKIESNIDIDPSDSTPVAPLIFISLIENAFKHGISPQGAGYIKIAISQHDGEISCEIVNSCYPKRGNDKSGSGIGLEQVSRRLELMYPGRYVWEKGTSEDGSEYYSRIIINKKEES